MESSGHYWLPLASNMRRIGYPVAIVHPLEAERFAKSRLQLATSGSSSKTERSGVVDPDNNPRTGRSARRCL